MRIGLCLWLCRLAPQHFLGSGSHLATWLCLRMATDMPFCSEDFLSSVWEMVGWLQAGDRGQEIEDKACQQLSETRGGARSA
jgi:hypothetical protein